MTSEDRVRVEAATLAAIDILASLHEQAFDQDEKVWNAAAFADLLGMPGMRAWLAVDSQGPAENPVGFMLVGFAADEGEIITTGVVPAARRRGVARKLLDEACLMADALGASLLLEVAVSNKPAIELYKLAGFEEAGRRQDYYRRGSGEYVDALVLRRPALTG